MKKDRSRKSALTTVSPSRLSLVSDLNGCSDMNKFKFNKLLVKMFNSSGDDSFVLSDFSSFVPRQDEGITLFPRRLMRSSRHYWKMGKACMMRSRWCLSAD